MSKKIDLSKRVVMLPSPIGHTRPCPIITDPQGCYAGKPIEQMETPVQLDGDLPMDI